MMDGCELKSDNVNASKEEEKNKWKRKTGTTNI